MAEGAKGQTMAAGGRTKRVFPPSISVKRARVVCEEVVVHALDPMGPGRFGACTGLGQGDIRIRGEAISRMAECLLGFGSMLHDPVLVGILKRDVLLNVRTEFSAVELDLGLLSWGADSVLSRSVATFGVDASVYEDVVRSASLSIYDFLRKDVSGFRGVVNILAGDGLYWKAYVSEKTLLPTMDTDACSFGSCVRYYQLLSYNLRAILQNSHLSRIIQVDILRRVRVEFEAINGHLSVLMNPEASSIHSALASLRGFDASSASLRLLHALAGGGSYWCAHAALRAGRDAAVDMSREAFAEAAFAMWVSQFR